MAPQPPAEAAASPARRGLILPLPSEDGGRATAAAALSLDVIQATVERALADAEGAPSDSQDAFKARVERVALSCPGFAEAYPKLLEVACSSTTRERAASVRAFLPMMLAQMREMNARTSSFEEASRVVGIALGDRFLPPPAAHPSP